MVRTTIRRAATAVVLLVALLCQGTWALAGTTGGLVGSVVDAQSHAPIAGAKVTVNSPSQMASTTTDAAGHFAFVSLAPDTYTVAVEHPGYDPVSEPGQSVFADSTQTVAINMSTALRTIASVRSRGASSLVKSGTTSDVYSINAATQQAVKAVGGGGGLNSAYSAIATVPGAYVAGNQAGYAQTIHIRGGDFDQVGYEFDGVPINRSFDNYPSGSASSLGQQEVQVYTGASPANSEGQGLAGYVNQVIKTGTYPGYASADLGIGTPVYYHHADVEAGGASPNRLFSYYVGLGGYNQDYRYIDSSNGSGYSPWLGIVAPGYGQVPFEFGSPDSTSVRNAVINLHFAIPHHKDGGRDDIQVLWDSESINTMFYSSPEVVSGDPSYGKPYYMDGYGWTMPTGTLLNGSQLTGVNQYLTPYMYPNAPSNTLSNAPGLANSCPPNVNNGICSYIPTNAADTSWNNQEIFKVQYQKNFGSSAYLRVYGYTYYSNWMMNGPNTAYGIGAISPDYELSGHTHGYSASFSDQINEKNLLTAQVSYTTANSIRDNNDQMYNGSYIQNPVMEVVNAANPYSGYCYSAKGAAVSCNPNYATGAQSYSLYQIATAPGGTLAPLPATCAQPGVASTTCAYLAADNGEYGTYNNVTPEFTSYSLTDEFRPSDKWLINAGIRWDNYKFIGQNLSQNPVSQFWYNAYDMDTCIGPNGQQYDVSQLGANPGACPTGYRQSTLSNDLGQPVEEFMEFQPRLSMTYTVNPDTVLRGSIGKYVQPPTSADEQYATLQLDTPFTLLGTKLYPYRNTPSASIDPESSTNVDLSLEKHIKGTDMSFKLTPFYRHTENQIQNFYLNETQGFVSGLNVGAQSSRGVEFQFQKGDFSRNGLAALLSFAYTYSTIKYNNVPGTNQSILSPINSTIANYNAYTKACAPGGSSYGKSAYGQSLCGATQTGAVAAPYYTAQGAPSQTYAAGDIANPYWNSPAQGLINPSQAFPTYDVFPAGIGSSASAYGAPYVSTLVLNYKHNKWAFTPSLQFQAGTRYGAPETTPGYAPDVASSMAYGSPGQIVIPDPYTGQFDPMGSFVQPSQLMLNAQLTYEVSPRVTLTASFANIVDTCFGGTKNAWTTAADHNICSYGIVDGSYMQPYGNTIPTGTKYTVLNYPYEGYPGPYDVAALNSTVKQPFQMYFEAHIKL